MEESKEEQMNPQMNQQTPQTVQGTRSNLMVTPSQFELANEFGADTLGNTQTAVG